MKPAPDFSLPDQTGRTRSLKDFAGGWLVLYFYPEDDTPGCTAEACAFRDDAPEYAKAGVTVVGVSRDSVDSHAAFAAKHRLDFTLLSDESRAAHEAYGAWGLKTSFGKTYTGASRKTFLIDPDGNIAKEYPKVIPIGHSGKILKDLTKLRG